jgi:predicted permease
VRALRAAGPDLLPRASAIGLDGPVLAFALVAVAGSLLVFGVLPALQLSAARTDIASTLRAGARSAGGAARDHRLRRVLVASQFAVAMPLLVGAVLLVTSFMNLRRVDPGYAGEPVFTARISRIGVRNGDDARFWDRLVERVRAVPGVAAAGLNSGRPPREPSDVNNFDPLDRPTPPGESEPTAVWLIASPGYFDALGVKLVAGRMFDETDSEDRPTTSALVDRTWARTVYPGEDPIGRRLYEGGCRAADCSIVEVVGVVEDVRYLGMDDAQSGTAVGTVYVPQRQWNASSSYLFARVTAGDPLSVTSAIRAIVRDLDPTAPLTDVTTAGALVDDALAAPRNLAGVVAGFGAVALVLAMIGIYGVMSFFVREHRRDIGIRLALGGGPAAVLRLVMARGLTPVGVGVLVGGVAALIVTRFLARLLYGVSPRDPLTLAIVAFAMLATAIAACWLPAREAARVDPIRTLREE